MFGVIWVPFNNNIADRVMTKPSVYLFKAINAEVTSSNATTANVSLLVGNAMVTPIVWTNPTKASIANCVNATTETSDVTAPAGVSL